jgi:uncharacterized membrane protein
VPRHNGHVLARVIRREVTPQTEIIISATFGVVAAIPPALVGTPLIAALVGLDVASVVYLVWVWSTTWRLDCAETKRRATAFDLHDARVRDVILLSAAIASLAAVGFVIARAGQTQGAEEVLQVAVGLASVVLSWAVVHTVYMLRYAHLYYLTPKRAVDFNTDTAPAYSDFAYLAFTIGMTFQVSDTPLTSQTLRRTALRHALLSYLFGTGILATTINLVASISSK